MVKQNWHKLNFNVKVSPLTIITEKAGEKVKDFWISGDAINETITRNNYRYTGEELGKAAHTFIGRPLLTDHEALIKNVIGIVEEAEFRDGAIKFKARIPNIPATEEIRSKIDAGILNNVSIGAKVDDLVEEAEGVMRVQGLEFLELSLVPIPGDANATIGNALSESYKIKVGETMNEDLVKRIEELEKKLSELTKTPVKEETPPMPPVPPAEAPAPAQPVIAPAVVVEPTQDGQVAASPAQAQAPAQPEAPMPPSEKLSELVAKEVAKLMKPKSVVETTKIEEKITKTGNLTISEDEKGKFIIERASNGKVRFWRE